MQLIYEQSAPGRRGVKLPASDVPAAAALPAALLRTEPAGLAEVSELDLVRHFTNLSRRNFSVDTNFYPLGSCTMKYNAKVLENAAALFAPVSPDDGAAAGRRANSAREPWGCCTTWGRCWPTSPAWTRSPPSRWPAPMAR